MPVRGSTVSCGVLALLSSGVRALLFKYPALGPDSPRLLVCASKASADPFPRSRVTYESSATIRAGTDTLKWAWLVALIAGNRRTNRAIARAVFIENEGVLRVVVAHALAVHEIPGCRLDAVALKGCGSFSRASLDATTVHNGVILRHDLGAVLRHCGGVVCAIRAGAAATVCLGLI